MKEKFKWGKFIIDCFLRLGIVVMPPFIYSYLIKNDDLRWILYPFQWLLQPTQWLLYPLHWFFDIKLTPSKK